MLPLAKTAESSGADDPHEPAGTMVRFSAGFYFQSLTGLLGSPRSFFTRLRGQEGLRTPFLFLLFSALFHTGACLTYIMEHRVLMAGVILMNALVMPLAGAAGAFLTSRMLMGTRISFAGLFAVYAYAAGVTLLASWIPLFVWITEPWKWILVALGLVRFGGLTWPRALVVLTGSLVITFLFFGSLSPALLALKGLLT
jgi:hypothetical protein